MTVAYGAALLVSLAGMLTVDRRFRLAVFAADRRVGVRAVVTILVGVAFFLLWDGLGVGLGIFFVGPGRYQSGLLLAPDIPVEEVGFLLLLCHLTLVLAASAERWVVPRVGRGGRA